MLKFFKDAIKATIIEKNCGCAGNHLTLYTEQHAYHWQKEKNILLVYFYPYKLQLFSLYTLH